MYDSIQYAKTRLLNTVVRDSSDNFIHIIDTNDGDQNLDDSEIDSLEWVGIVAVGEDYYRILCNFRHLNIKPSRLGYTMVNGKYEYLCRQPLRNDWRQGLRERSLVVKPNYIVDKGMPAVVDNIELLLESLSETHKGNYPTLTDAIEQVIEMDEPCIVAFDREFAVAMTRERLMRVLYRNEAIGSVYPDRPEDIELDHQYLYLKERLEGIIHAN